jgi:hypothetical protein
MEDHAASDELATWGIDPAPVRRLWTDFKAGRNHRSDLVWQMFILMAWSADSARDRQNSPVAGVVC